MLSRIGKNAIIAPWFVETSVEFLPDSGEKMTLKNIYTKLN